jgi:ribosome-binding factor A
MSQRIDRVDELLRQEIGALLAKELADPRIGFTTITDVETSPDLRHAKVWVSVIGGRTDRVETVRALQASMGYVRHELGKLLRIKRIPELHIHLDDSAERGTRLLHLLGELEAGVDPLEVQPFNESLPTPVKRLPHEGDTPEETAPAADGSEEGSPATPPPGPELPKRRAPYRGAPGVDRRGRGGSAPGKGPATHGKTASAHGKDARPHGKGVAARGKDASPRAGRRPPGKPRG